MHRRWTTLLIAAATALAVASAVTPADAVVASAGSSRPSTSATGGIGLRLLEAPESLRDDPRAHTYIIDHVAPGAVFTRTIEVSNSSTTVQHVELYSTGAAIADGSFVGDDRGVAGELATWVSTFPAVVDVPANGTSTAAVTVAVPVDAAPGERYGVVWAEVRTSNATGIVQASRVGIRAYLSVGGGNPPSTDFTIDSITASRGADGAPVVLATITNTGGRALDVNGSLTLSAGPAGLSAGPFAASSGETLAIGDTEPVTVVLDSALPAGPWTVTVTMTSGVTTRTATARILFPDAGTSTPVEATSADHAEDGGLWWIVAGLVGIVVLAAVAGVVVVRRRRG